MTENLYTEHETLIRLGIALAEIAESHGFRALMEVLEGEANLVAKQSLRGVTTEHPREWWLGRLEELEILRARIPALVTEAKQLKRESTEHARALEGLAMYDGGSVAGS